MTVQYSASYSMGHVLYMCHEDSVGGS